jgi:hypothetical protein
MGQHPRTWFSSTTAGFPRADAAWLLASDLLPRNSSLSDNGIEIYAVRSGECWDIIWDSDISPKEFDNGWGCGLCIDAWAKGLYPKPDVYASPNDLWIEHTLGPFRGWLEKLVASAGIAFIDYDGATDARLLQEGEQISQLTVEIVKRSL